MFPRGPRFAPPKIPDVPGPNTYNVAQESQLDTYKRGAFLEKTDRFSKEKASEIPGPGAYDVDTKPLTKPSTKPAPNISEKYTILQKKLEDLERLHAEGKKSHQAELEGLKSDLARVRKSNTEYSERLDKLKKQNDALEARVQELKKVAGLDQSEIKDLRVKLRLSEHERAQLSAKTGEAGEAKKATQTLEMKRKEDIKERDKRIAELERALSTENKKFESAETKLQLVTKKTNAEAQEAKEVTRRLQAELDTVRNAAKQTQSLLVTVKDQYQILLKRAAEEYGQLASQLIPTANHLRVKHERAALQMRVARLERKLSNSEAQVTELASLVRHTTEENAFLSSCLRDNERELAFYSEALASSRHIHGATPSDALLHLSTAIGQEINDSERLVQNAHLVTIETFCRLYQSELEELMILCSTMEDALRNEQALTKKQSSELSEAQAAQSNIQLQCRTLRQEYDHVQQQLITANVLLQESRTAFETQEREMEGMRARRSEEVAKSEQILKKERDINQHLSSTIQQHKIAEEEFRAEIERLTTELTDVERYQEAYYSLTDEVSALLARNALAEEEAHKLSKFNAEILGHNNPAQRIMYVDRIRRELADTKHQLLTSTRAYDTLVADNDELRCELGTYKSVMVPAGEKPRTNMTRIVRPPLTAQDTNHDPQKQISEVDYDVGEMTLDEIM